MAEQRVLFKECRHERTLVIKKERSSVHHAKEVCADCKKFLRWIPKPETVQQQAKNIQTLAILCTKKNLTDWERNFIRSVSGLKHLSPKQQTILDELGLKYYLEKKRDD